MKHFTKISVVLALMLGVVLSVYTPAKAQNAIWRSSDYKVNAQGSGEIRFRGRNEDVNSVVINLRRNGRADVTFHTDRTQAKFEGSWNERSFNNGRAQFSLDLRGSYSSFSDDLNGSLTLERYSGGLVEVWRVRNLSLSGQDRNNRITVSFDGTRNNNGGGNNDGYNGGSGNFQEHSGEARGGGRVREGRNDTNNINRVNVRLSRGGAADITLYGDSTVRITGRWRSVGNDRAEISVDRYDGRDANRGSGRIEFRRKSNTSLDLERLSLSGRTSRGDFSVDFSVYNNGDWDDNDNNNGGNSGGIDSSQRGRGTLRTSGQGNVRLTRASVNLDKGGRAQIIVEASNGTRYTVSGRWTRDRDREFNITVSAALSYNNASGRGTIRLRNDRDFSSIDLSGNFGNRDWSIDFDAD